MSVNAPVAVLGAGNWGTTASLLATKAGRDVRLWTREPAQRDEINDQHTNQRYTRDAKLSPRIRATTDLAEAIDGVPLILVIIPSKGFREVSRALGPILKPDQLVIHGTKGLELGTHRRMSEILREETCARQIGVLSGPNIANEILQGGPAGTVIASKFPRVVEEGRRALASSVFRVFESDDVVGTELASALKNVVAIAAGAAHEMKLGENANAMLVSRGLAEIAQLGRRLGAQPSSFFGLAGIGDLVVTCASHHSRNHRLGVALAKGTPLKTALDELGMVAEGVNTALAVHQMMRGRRAPALFDCVYRVLYEGLTPADALRELMSLPTGHDVGRALRLG